MEEGTYTNDSLNPSRVSYKYVNIRISSCNVSGMFAFGATPYYYTGGFVFGRYSSIALERVNLSNNTAADGGSIGAYGSHILIDRVIDINSSSYRNGGSIYYDTYDKRDESSFYCTSSSFVFCSTKGCGGAAYITRTNDAYFQDCAFNSSTAFSGGALFASDSSVNIFWSVFDSNYIVQTNCSNNVSQFSKTFANFRGGGAITLVGKYCPSLLYTTHLDFGTYVTHQPFGRFILLYGNVSWFSYDDAMATNNTDTKEDIYWRCIDHETACKTDRIFLLFNRRNNSFPYFPNNDSPFQDVYTSPSRNNKASITSSIPSPTLFTYVASPITRIPQLSQDTFTKKPNTLKSPSMTRVFSPTWYLNPPAATRTLLPTQEPTTDYRMKNTEIVGYTPTLVEINTTTFSKQTADVSNTITSIMKSTTITTNTFVNSSGNITWTQTIISTETPINTLIIEEINVIVFSPVNTITEILSPIIQINYTQTEAYKSPKISLVETYIGVDATTKSQSYVLQTTHFEGGFTTYLTLTQSTTTTWTETLVNWVSTKVLTECTISIPTIVSTFLDSGGVIRYASPTLTNFDVFVSSLTTTDSYIELFVPIHPDIIAPTFHPTLVPIPSASATNLPENTPYNTPLTPYPTFAPTRDFRMSYTYAPSIMEFQTSTLLTVYFSTMATFSSTTTQYYFETLTIKSTWCYLVTEIPPVVNPHKKILSIQTTTIRTYQYSMFSTYKLVQQTFTEPKITLVYYPQEILINTFVESTRNEYTGIEKYISPYPIIVESLVYSSTTGQTNIFIDSYTHVVTGTNVNIQTRVNTTISTFTIVESLWTSVRVFSKVITEVPTNTTTFLPPNTNIPVVSKVEIITVFGIETYMSVQSLTGYFSPLPTNTFAPTRQITPKPTNDPLYIITTVPSLMEQVAKVPATLFLESDTLVYAGTTNIWVPTNISKFTWTDHPDNGRTYIYTKVGSYVQTITEFSSSSITKLINPTISSIVTLTGFTTLIQTSMKAFSPISKSTVSPSLTESKIHTNVITYPIIDSSISKHATVFDYTFIPISTTTFTNIPFGKTFIRTYVDTIFVSPSKISFIATTNTYTNLFIQYPILTDTYSEFITYLTVTTNNYLPFATRSPEATPSRSPTPSIPPRTPNSAKEFLSAISTETVIVVEVTTYSESMVQSIISIMSEFIFVSASPTIVDGEVSMVFSSTVSQSMTNVLSEVPTIIVRPSLLETKSMLQVLVLVDIPTPYDTGLTTVQIIILVSSLVLLALISGAIIFFFYYINNEKNYLETDPFAESAFVEAAQEDIYSRADISVILGNWNASNVGDKEPNPFDRAENMDDSEGIDNLDDIHNDDSAGNGMPLAKSNPEVINGKDDFPEEY